MHVATHTHVACLEFSTHYPRHAAWPSNTPPSRFARRSTCTQAGTQRGQRRAQGTESPRAGPARLFYWLQEAENFLSATTTSASTTQVASRAAITMAAMAPGPSDPVEDRGPCYPSHSQIQPRPGPRMPSFPLIHLPPLFLLCPRLTSILVHSCWRGAVLWCWSRGGEWGARDCKFLFVASALQGTFTRGQFNRVIPQGGIGLLGPLCCKVKNRQWNSGSMGRDADSPQQIN